MTTLHEYYMEEVLADYCDFCEEWFDCQEMDELPHDLDELCWKIDDDAFCSDAVTGNGERGYSSIPPQIGNFWLDEDLMQVLGDYLTDTDSMESFCTGMVRSNSTTQERCRWVDCFIRLAYYDYLSYKRDKMVQKYCESIGFKLDD